MWLMRQLSCYLNVEQCANELPIHNVFDEDLLEQIFLIYGDICSVRTGLKSNNYDKYHVLRVATLISRYFNSVENGEAKLKSKYIELLEQLKTVGRIIDNDED